MARKRGMSSKIARDVAQRRKAGPRLSSTATVQPRTSGSSNATDSATRRRLNARKAARAASAVRKANKAYMQSNAGIWGMGEQTFRSARTTNTSGSVQYR